MLKPGIATPVHRRQGRSLHRGWSGARPWLFVLVSVAIPAPVTVAAPGFHLESGDHILYAWRDGKTQEGQRVVYLSFRSPDAAAKGQFAASAVGPYAGAILRATVVGENLHVFYSDGTHQRFSPEQGLMPAYVALSSRRELDLPENAVPVAMAADADGDALIAVVTRDQARAVAAAQAERKRREADRESAESPADPPIDGSGVEAEDAALQAVPVPTSPLVFVRYTRNGWQVEREAPADLTDASAVEALWLTDDATHLLYRPTGESSRYLFRKSDPAGDSWSAPSPIDMQGRATRLTLGKIEDEMVLAGVLARGERSEVATWRWTVDAWRPGPVLLDQSGASLSLAGAVTVAIYDNAIFVGELIGEGKPRVARFSIGDGKPTAPWQPVEALGTASPPTTERPVRQVVEWVILAFALAAIFIWRRESIIQPPLLARGEVLASLYKRALAIVVDMLIVMPFWGAILFKLFTMDAMPLIMRVSTNQPALYDKMHWAPAIVGATVALYGMIFESAVGATPGKRILNMRVRRATGGPATVGQVLTRNLMRVLEFHFLPVLLLLAVTMGRQRLGDLLARTIVVEIVDDDDEARERETRTETPPDEPGDPSA